MIPYIFFFNIFFLFFSYSLRAEGSKDASLDKENVQLKNEIQKTKEFYELRENENWRDITEKILNSPSVFDENKVAIRSQRRRIIVFKYPSDGLMVKGFLSYTPSPTLHPLLILYRGGNEDFGLLNPSIVYAIYGNYTVVSSALRGGVSQGKDEFGGADVDDIKNLIEFLPTLSEDIGIELKPPCTFMLGISRGGLEMFLTLARFPELQNRINKAVALSAILDLHRLIRDRPQDMKSLLEKQYGFKDGSRKGDVWISQRDPLNSIPLIKKSLPILIIQGGADNRINLAEGYHMTNSLEKSGHSVNYWEIPNGNHGLMNDPFMMANIAQWLESNSACVSIRIPTNH